ncbi:MAG: helix-turn-helix domain-containing protein [Burkholderiales bacterium]|nr:helix-turn-helix domain-containing protein [Burkholderiales bacterium]
MGRPSNLPESKWDELGRRLIAGEKAADLAREYKVSRSAVSKRFSKQTETVKDVAQQIVGAEEALAKLPVSQQINAINLAQQLRSISHHLASAANYGAATAHRLTALANSEVQKIDDANPLGSVENLKGVAALSKLANESAAIGLNLLAANKDRAKQMVDAEVNDATIPADPIEAAQAYQSLMGG